jgi:hypothetical protein
MALPTEFWEQLPLETDAELYDMLSHQEDYLPEAIAAARDELSKRNLAPERVAQLEARAQSETAEAEAKAKEPLGWPMRIFIFIFCAGLFGALLRFIMTTRAISERRRIAGSPWASASRSICSQAFCYMRVDSHHRIGSRITPVDEPSLR